jgi:extradiol dioxygenase family protein
MVLLLVMSVPVAFSGKGPVSAVRGGFLALSVADLDASATWYVQMFDLTIVKSHSESPDKKSMATILMGHGLIVELIQHADAMPLHRAAPALTQSFQIYGIFKAGIVVDDVDATLKELEARKVDVAFRIFKDDALGLRTFAIRDNAGNVIQFFGR